MKRQTTKEEFDTVINGQDVCIGFTRTTVYGRENYGADADGRRGMMIDTIDEDEYTDIICGDLDPTDPAVTDVIEEYMETHPPEPEDVPEPDYDDIDD